MSSAPDPPAPVDPYAAASAQGTANAQTAIAQTLLNNPNQITPYGTSTNTQTGSYTGTNPDGSTYEIPTYTNTQTLSNPEQRLLNQSQDLGIYGNQIAGVALGNVAGALSNPLTTDSFKPIQTKYGSQNTYDQGPAIQTSYSQGTPVQTSFDQGGPLQYSYGSGGNIQSSVNLNTNAPTTFANTANQVQGSLGDTNFSADRDAATNAVLQRLQPTTDQQTANLQAQLANEGLTQGSASYNAGMFQNNQAVNDLRLGAVQTGDAEQQALFGESLNAGQFANSAQQQEYDQALGRGQFAQAGVGQNNAAVLNEGVFANSAQAQGNAQNAQAAAFNNQTAGQQYAQNEGAAAFSNQGAAQQYAQNAGEAAFGNTAAGQIASQNRDAAGFYNMANANAAQFHNESQQQQYTQGIGLNNQALNQVDALRSGGQVTSPQFQGYSAGTIDQTPISADIYSSANLAQQAYNTQEQMAASTNAGLYGLGSSFLGGVGQIAGGGKGLLGIVSDRRAKRDIKRVGVWPNGIPIYRYRYLGSDDPDIGFMADDVEKVRPDAVARDEFGFARVDYEKAMA